MNLKISDSDFMGPEFIIKVVKLTLASERYPVYLSIRTVTLPDC